MWYGLKYFSAHFSQVKWQSIILQVPYKMFGFGKRKKNDDKPVANDSSQADQENSSNSASETEQPQGLFARLKSGLARSRSHFTQGLSNLILGKKKIDDELLEIHLVLIWVSVRWGKLYIHGMGKRQKDQSNDRTTSRP